MENIVTQAEYKWINEFGGFGFMSREEYAAEPTFGLIEEHRALKAKWLNCDDDGESDCLCNAQSAKFWELVEFSPASIEGIVAKLQYIFEQTSEDQGAATICEGDLADEDFLIALRDDIDRIIQRKAA
jgi:hypothetical protein